MNKLGSHIRFTKATNYLPGAVQEAYEFGCNTMMIFMGSPHTSKRVDIELYQKDLYLSSTLSKKILPHDIIAHGPYIINPANPNTFDYVVSFLIDEITRLKYIGGNKFVLHPGSNVDNTIGIQSVAKVVKKVLEKVDDVYIAIENMSAKGNQIGSSFEDLSQILKLINHERAGICLDTCHAWDNGYDIQNFNKVLNQFDSIIGLSHLLVIHLNDSKNPKSSHKDRHANIGDGFIGFEALQNVYKNKRICEIPKILETPWVNNKPIYKQEIRKLKGK